MDIRKFQDTISEITGIETARGNLDISVGIQPGIDGDETLVV